MPSIQEIEQAIARLPRDEFFELVRHLRERHADEWDRQMEEDAKNGGLDRLWEKAKKEIEGGGLRPLDEILDGPGLSQALGANLSLGFRGILVSAPYRASFLRGRFGRGFAVRPRIREGPVIQARS